MRSGSGALRSLWPRAGAAVSLVVLLAAGATATPGRATTAPPASSIGDIIARIESEHLRYAFIGERHGVGPVKRFAVDLVNGLVDRGHDVGLYVEGFRVGCALDDAACNRLAALFNPGAYRTLSTSSLAPVHPIDPVGREHRAAAMAAAVAAGREPIRVVLLGRSHMLYAGRPGAELKVFGGAVDYPDPGDVAEAFPRRRTVTIAAETVDSLDVPYVVRPGGDDADYVLETTSSGAY